ncbi:hypothetical protein [Kitasatospora sp. NPDC059827]|uniref:hypothetical protein n=1 Tax=Kitasatospora sp. NPDC059827 TaxID=3346964 RepID=UPI0036473048
MTTHAVEDQYFRTLAVTLDTAGGFAEVSGELVPTGTVRRRPGSAAQAPYPIGTGDSTLLTAQVQDEPLALTPGPARFRRGTWYVDALLGTTAYRLAARSTETSTLTRDGEDIATFEAHGNEWISAAWQRPVDPQDATVGYLLALAFGTGAQTAPRAFVMALLDSIPGQ